MEPYLVKEIRDPAGEVTRQRSPRVVRQVISEKTAQRVTSIMEEVVKQGSGVNAYMEGYRIAGKTGTAQKVGPEGFYLGGEYILSFIGFAPVEDPQVLLYIAVDGAKKGPQWGSQVSAPLFKNIMKDVLSYLEIPPSELPREEIREVEVPDLKGLTVDEAAALLDTRGLLIKLVGKKGIITEQTPKAGVGVPLQTSILVYLDDIWNNEEDGKLLMPDLLGMTVKEAGEILSMLGLKMEPVGSGVVTMQDVPAGTLVERGAVVKVTFSSPLH